jgi:hypothetical protein
MYYVISKWQMTPGKEEQFKQVGEKMRDFMRQQPGVEFADGMTCEDGNALALIGYSSEQAYRTITAEGGPFETEARKHNIESYGTWMWSERGNSIDRVKMGV